MRHVLALLVVVAAVACRLTAAYLLIATEDDPPGHVLFNASLGGRGARTYSINNHRSASFVHRLLRVDPDSGRISLRHFLDCTAVYYPNLFTLHVDSTALADPVDYYSLPLRVFVSGRRCERDPLVSIDLADEAEEQDVALNRVHVKVSEAKRWVSETLASYAIPKAEATDWTRICLRKSQLVCRIRNLLPRTVVENCNVRYVDVSDPRFKMEFEAGDLVAADSVCIAEPLWKVTVHLELICNTSLGEHSWPRPQLGGSGLISATEHRLKIVFHHQKFNDSDIAHRVRRELRNMSPYFEQALYLASVLEERPEGAVVATVKARDPENSPIQYSMVSLLDARSQGMFGIDTKTGVVTTATRLDRELVDVHYFRVTAVDDSFPPRSGTTTLQINVLDANDHSPVFEAPEYEASIRESVPVGSTVVTLKATDQDIDRNAEVEYTIQSEQPGEAGAPETFRIEPKSGTVSTRAPLDREKVQRYSLVIVASDMAVPLADRRSSSATVLVNILDDNDNYPQFTERSYSVTVPEDIAWSSNPVIAHVKATDADEGPNAAIRYAIIGGNTQSQFAIDTMSGEVSLVKPLDYEVIKNYRLVIRAQDGGGPSRSNTTQLLVNVKDVNDNAPRFYTSLFQESVLESVPVGYSIVRVQAYDADEGDNAAIHYSIGPRDSAGGSTDELPVTVDESSGWIFTTRELDREEHSKYQFLVLAADGGSPPRSATASVVVTVQDVNDNDPVFNPREYNAVVAEDDQPGTPVASVTATDRDENPRLHYELTAGNLRGRFAITTQNGRGLITVAQPLDYKQEKRFVLEVTASDSGGRHDTATVYVNISDANNYAPMFENAPYSASVFEDAPVGTTVLVVGATDGDVGQNAQITYSLGGDKEIPEFTINPQTGAVVTAKPLDRETVSGYLLTVTARDGGAPPLSDTTDVEIMVADVNDNAPTFRQSAYSGTVAEDALIGTSVAQVTASDADTGLNGRIRYALNPSGAGTDEPFVMDPTSGVIRTNRMLDRESVAVYQLEALAIDRGSPALSSSVIVTIKVEDINDNPPAFESDKLVMYVAENSPVGSTVGEIYAKDPDEGANAQVQYSIIGGDDSSSFSLITKPGSAKASLVTMVELDYESPRKKFELVVRAASPPLRTDVHVDVLVTDVNDNAPRLKDFQVLFNNFRDCFPSGAVGRIPAVDADVSDQLRFRILSGNNANLVHLNESSGHLTLSPLLNTNVPKLATMEVSVSDGVNEVKAVMQLQVRLITEEMLFNSITVRLEDMTEEAFLSPLLSFFVEGLAAIIPCPKENVFLFSVQDDTDVNAKILNVSFSARRPDVSGEEYYTPQFLQERVYLNRAILARLATVKVLPFDDNLCVREPCLNYEECLTVLKFGNASGFISSDTVLFRPIYPVTTFACRCPAGFTGSREHYLCDREVNLCYSNPCQNEGECVRREGGYTCVCAAGFTGVHCETSLANGPGCAPGLCRPPSVCAPLIRGGFVCEKCTLPQDWRTEQCELRARSFTRSAFLTFPALRQRHRLHIRLKFATLQSDGLLLYDGRYNERHDFIALEVVGGELHFSFSLGDGVTRVSVAVPGPGGVSDGRWHTVTVSYLNKAATLSVDDCDTSLAIKHGTELGAQWACANRSQHVLEPRCDQPTETCHRFLDLTGPLQIGGLPALPTTDFQVRSKDFTGCITDLHIDHAFVDLNSFVADNGTVAGCPEKRPHCASAPCQHGGECREGWGTFVCDCPDKWGSKDCSEPIKLAWRFRGDGVLSFNPLLRPIQLPWLNSLSIRTLQRDAFLMSIQIGQNSTARLSLEAGALVYEYHGDRVALQGGVADGEWHRIDVRWLPGEVWLGLDHGQRSAVGALPAKVQGLYVGKILIGGPDAETPPAEAAALPRLDGCIQDVRVGTPQSALQRPNVKENVGDGCGSGDACAGPLATDHCPSAAATPAHSRCEAHWERASCTCNVGYVGSACAPVCSLNPCENGARCTPVPVADSAPRGYTCSCNSTEFSGEYCEVKVDQPCPTSWWGYPVCGPCHCPVDRGYNPDCNKATGECVCRENHYQPEGSDRCLDCGCYAVGSFSSQCDPVSGQCRCRAGVIGRTCHACPNPYAEVTLRGCEVVYDGCPRSFAAGMWWERTKFGQTVIESCPGHSHGKASRVCDDALGGWQEPDLFNCTSDAFLDLRRVLGQMERGELSINSFVAVKVASDLGRAVNRTQRLHGSDVLIDEQLSRRLLTHELGMSGLNLTHSQDKDYIAHLVQAVSKALEPDNAAHWERISELTGETAEHVMVAVDQYIGVLTRSQRDTYTNPFEIVADNVVLGLDVVTAESLFGYESHSVSRDAPPTPRPDAGASTPPPGQVVIPDTSQFLQPALLPLTATPGSGGSSAAGSGTPVVVFPKYNNYLQDPRKFDPYTQIMVPLSLLGIRAGYFGETSTRQSPAAVGQAVLSYVQYRTLGPLLPDRYDETVLRRWGVDLRVGSPVVSLAAYVPGSDKDKDPVDKEKAAYRPLGGHLNAPVRVRLWLDPQLQVLGPRANPQCVYWREGQWSRAGCQTEVQQTPMWRGGVRLPVLINCTCSHLSTFAVLVDVVDLDYIPEPSDLEDAATWLGFTFALPLLLTALIILAFIRGLETNSNSIHKNLVFCVFLAETIYFAALKARRSLVIHEFACKMTAMSLHYLWLSAFAWALVDSIHLYRMLTEMRDINHGPMRFYYTLGYGLPAILVGLAVGVRADQYGNFYFCWLSLYESVVWSLIGPVCCAVLINLIVLLMAIRAAFTLKDHIMAFGNLRTLLWLSVVALPLLGATWVLAVLAVSERLPIVSYGLAAAVFLHALFCLIGYCFVNERVRKNLRITVLRCMGKKVPLVEETCQTANHMQPRSSLAYRNSARMESLRRNIGISTSSTTSRSTAKTGSSPYRSDGHLRNTNTSTSTSNYNSGSELPSYLRGYDSSITGGGQLGRHNEDTEDGPSNTDKRTTTGHTSDSDSEASVDGRSLELASSHSSDEDESSHHNSSRRRRHQRGLGVSNHSTTSAETAGTNPPSVQASTYMPNIYPIAEGDVSPTDMVQPPPTLNIVSKAALFPNLKPMYAPRWSSQLPDTYVTANSMLDSMSLRNNQWSGLTDLDHYYKDYQGKTSASPSPHPLPQLTKMMSSSDNFHELGEVGSETEEKVHMGDKYLFPYTAEEDHCGRSLSLNLGMGLSNNYELPHVGMDNGVGMGGDSTGRGSPSPLHHPGALTSSNVSESEKDTEDMSETPV
ncbi:protocadherin-like wing polarity protein stan isoform X1 [Frankliniella occidentalis]|uniref:Protocadherin-like wing polarity protein stan isoform X1 n=1 Tax=Frankliniella occidentalis TaxID=133901 RepID=A0A9C6XS59_FRAOC|nr:protocadherin-like wing polarity protein stan isoform X1 [Frankliniella occidentalis]